LLASLNPSSEDEEKLLSEQDELLKILMVNSRADEKNITLSIDSGRILPKISSSS